MHLGHLEEAHLQDLEEVDHRLEVEEHLVDPVEVEDHLQEEAERLLPS